MTPADEGIAAVRRDQARHERNRTAHGDPFAVLETGPTRTEDVRHNRADDRQHQEVAEAEQLTFEEIDELDPANPNSEATALALRPVGNPACDRLAESFGGRFDDFGGLAVPAWVVPLRCRKRLAEAGARARSRVPVVEEEEDLGAGGAGRPGRETIS